MQNPSSIDLKLEKKSKKSKIEFIWLFLIYIFFLLDENASNNLGLYRGLSVVPANKSLVKNQRNILAQNYRRTSINHEIITLDHDDDDALFILPNLYELFEDTRICVMDNLVDKRIMKSLEETRIIFRRFYLFNQIIFRTS